MNHSTSQPPPHYRTDRMTTNATLSDHYAAYYVKGTGDWRDITARAKAENIVRLWQRTHDSRPREVVEIGCGDGAVLAQLEKRRFADAYVGTEMSVSALELARQRKFSSPVRWVHAAAGTTPLPDQSVDLVVLSHVVEHAADPRGLIAEAARIGRSVFVEVPLEHHWRSPRSWRWQSLGHINFFTPLTLRWLVESSIAPRRLDILAEQVTTVGLDALTFQHGRSGGWIRWATKVGLLRLLPWLATRLFTYHGSILAAAESAPQR